MTEVATTEPMTTGSNNCLRDANHTIEDSAVETTPDAEAAALPPNVPPAAEANAGDANIQADSWRVEVAARLERYRTRRKPRSPRYPSLMLPFDAPESWSRPTAGSLSGALATHSAQPVSDFAFATDAATAEDPEPDFAGLNVAGSGEVSEPRPEPRPPRYPEPSEQPGKVIEFPRSAAIPVFHTSDLADPVFDRARPRIVEAPEILPPPPALGGMLIEPADREGGDKLLGAESLFPSKAASASIGRRALAALVDGAILATALAGFAAIFFRLNPVREALPQFSWKPLAAAFAGVAFALWAGYEFLFAVYTGSTPGLRAARLQLASFDGAPVPRRLRRWRVLASFLSAVSLGLGYLWCLLDQDGLCWHDRITRTYVQSERRAE